MFALTDILNFESENIKSRILKSFWMLVAEYLVKLLVLLSLMFAGMQVTSGSFECLPAVECPDTSRPNSSSLSEIEYRNYVCEQYSSQNNNTEKTYVITDIKTTLQYTKWVNSECSKSAIPTFLAYFWLVLFGQSLALLHIGNLWLKLPQTASVIENFVTCVIECYDIPCCDLEITNILYSPSKKASTAAQHHVSAIKTLHEKVKKLREKMQTNVFRVYLVQTLIQIICAFIFLGIDLCFANDLKDTINCEISQHNLVPHDYFICSHNLALTFFGGIYMYIAILGVSIIIYLGIVFWAVNIERKYNCEYHLKETNSQGIKLCEIPMVKGDLGFLLYMLDHSNTLYVRRFAHFLLQKDKKKQKQYLEEYARKQVEKNSSSSDRSTGDV